MKLLTSGASPFARKVSIVILETGQDADVERVTVHTSPGAADPVLKAANPTARLPALVRDEGPALYDSRVICRYLDARAGGKLYPDGDWDALVLEATADGMMDSALQMVYERRFRPDELQSQDWIDAQWGKVDGGLDALESMWIPHLKGPLTIGPIAVACMLGYLDLRHADREWRATHPNLAAWLAEFAQRPSLTATVPVG